MEEGIADYRAVVFVRKDSGIADTDDLVGRVIAFEKHFLSSGNLLPRIAISQQGLRFGPVPNQQDSPEPDRIGFTSTGDDEKTMGLVLRGRVDAGVMSQGNFEKHAKGDRTGGFAAGVALDLRLGRPLADIWRPLLELGHSVRDCFPCRLGADEDMHPDLDLRISVHASQSDSVNFAVMCTTQG